MASASCRLASRSPRASVTRSQWNHRGSAHPSARYSKICRAVDSSRSAPAHHLCDPHRLVVGDHRQLIRRNVVPPPHRKIPKVLAHHKPQRPEVPILERDDLVVRNPKSPVHPRRLGIPALPAAPPPPSPSGTSPDTSAPRPPPSERSRHHAAPAQSGSAPSASTGMDTATLPPAASATRPDRSTAAHSAHKDRTAHPHPAPPANEPPASANPPSSPRRTPPWTAPDPDPHCAK